MGIPERSKLSPKIGIRETDGKGRGMFATESIAEGERVLVWGGEYVNSRGAEAAIMAGKHVMRWDEDLYSVEDRGDDPSYFINHSCDPNTWMQDAFTLVARRCIGVGEEVNVDYALFQWMPGHVSSWECRCGSPLCRGQVTGDDWKRPDLRKRYAGHFSPLINKMIDSEA